jgi:flagellar motor switch protein FliN/FliY
MNDFITTEQELDLRKIEEFFRESAETVLQTNINPEIALNLAEISQFDMKMFSEAFAEGLVVVKVLHKDQQYGEEYLIFSPKTVAKISDLMLMGDGNATFNPDEHLDPLQEIVDQIYGAFSNVEIASFNRDRNFQLANASFGDIALISMANESWAVMELVMDFKEEHHFFHLINPEALKNYILQPAEEESLITDIESTLSKVDDKRAESAPRTAKFQSFGPEAPFPQKEIGHIEMLMDLKLPIVIELGRTSMFIKDILKLAPGSIVELDKLSGDPVDIYVNEKKFAEGEVVVIDENFGVRITEVIKPEERVRKLS